MSLDPASPTVRLHLAQAQAGLEREEEALEGFAFVLERAADPESVVSAHLGRAAILRASGDSAAARIEMDAARRIFPDLDEWLHQLRLREESPVPVFVEAGTEFTTSGGTHPVTTQRLERMMAQIDANDAEPVNDNGTLYGIN